MKLSPLLALLLAVGSVALCPEITPAAPAALAQGDSSGRVQQLIDQQKYDLAWQEIRRVAREMDRAQVVFPIPVVGGGGETFLEEWSVKLGEAQIKNKQYQAAFQFANSHPKPKVQLEIANALHLSGQSQSARLLFSGLIKTYQKLPKADAQGNLAYLSGNLFRLGLVEESDRVLTELISTIGKNGGSLQNEQITILDGAGGASNSLERTIQVAERLKLSGNPAALDSMAQMAIQTGNGPVAEAYIQKLGRSHSKDRLWNLHHDLAVLYFSQRKSALGLKQLGEALVYAQISPEYGPDWRDGRLEDAALLYHQQKQVRKAESTAQKIHNLTLRNSVLAKLKRRQITIM